MKALVNKSNFFLKRAFFRAFVLFFSSRLPLDASRLTSVLPCLVPATLAKLYAHRETAVDFGVVAKGILVFPDVYKSGFLVGGQFGEGALLKNGRRDGDESF